MFIPVVCFLSEFQLPNDLQLQYEIIRDFRGAFYEYFDPCISQAEKNELNKKDGAVSSYPTLYFQPIGSSHTKMLGITAINPLSVNMMQKICQDFAGFQINNIRLHATGLHVTTTFLLQHAIHWIPFNTPGPINYSITQWLPWEEGTPEWQLWTENEGNNQVITGILEQKLNLQLNNEIGKYLVQEKLPAASITEWRVPHQDRFTYTRKGEDGKILVEKHFTVLEICFELQYYIPGGIALGFHKTFGFGRIYPL